MDKREIFIGLIAPIGVNLDAVEVALTASLKRVGYDVNLIKLTHIFEEFSEVNSISYSNEFDRYEKYIKAGDELCELAKRNDILALYGINRLNENDDRKHDDEVPTSVAHVFRQIKRVEEIDTLKSVYGRNILFVSCYAPKSDRVNNLVRKLLQNGRGRNRSDLESKALNIISIDEHEVDIANGQRVVECYAHADFVLDCTNNKSLSSSSDRLVEIYFGHPFISPTRDEYCSYFANAASYRSLDLSRQVGAAIFTDDCEIIALGCNEVPKAGGGTYWGDCDGDYRDHALGMDSNQQVRQDMARDALVRLQDNWLVDEYKELTPDRLSFKALSAKSAPLRNSMINDVIEYGRMVHAEMNAITDAARSNKSTSGAILYCTTMPCHMCAKLIVASGIKRAVYVQPYPKSLVEELFSDSVAVDSPSESRKVSFETLKGVTPNGFRLAFRKSVKRKNSNGTAKIWDPHNAGPSFVSRYPYYRYLEIMARKEYAETISVIIHKFNEKKKEIEGSA